MSILNTVKTHIERSENGIKIGNSTMNAINSLDRAGRNTFTADDITVILNNNGGNVTSAQVERAVKAELVYNKRGEIRRGFKSIVDLGMGFYQYGK